MRPITTKYPGVCKRCEKPVEQGIEAFYEKSMGIFHVGCEPKDTEEIRHFRKIKADAKADKILQRVDRLTTEAKLKLKSCEPFTSDIAFNTQPGHIPFRAKIIKREEKALKMLTEAESLESKAEAMRNVRVAGDAERKREEQRRQMDLMVHIGTKVYSPLYRRYGSIQRILRKSYRVKFDDGWVASIDKTYLKIIEDGKP